MSERDDSDTQNAAMDLPYVRNSTATAYSPSGLGGPREELAKARDHLFTDLSKLISPERIAQLKPLLMSAMKLEDVLVKHSLTDDKRSAEGFVRYADVSTARGLAYDAIYTSLEGDLKVLPAQEAIKYGQYVKALARLSDDLKSTVAVLSNSIPPETASMSPEYKQIFKDTNAREEVRAAMEDLARQLQPLQDVAQGMETLADHGDQLKIANAAGGNHLEETLKRLGLTQKKGGIAMGSGANKRIAGPSSDEG